MSTKDVLLKRTNIKKKKKKLSNYFDCEVYISVNIFLICPELQNKPEVPKVPVILLTKTFKIGNSKRDRLKTFH